MDNFSQMQTFFFISSVGFAIVAILVAVVLFYLIRSLKTFDRILSKMEDGVDNLGDTAKDMIDDVRDSIVYSFLFGRKRRRRKNE